MKSSNLVLVFFFSCAVAFASSPETANSHRVGAWKVTQLSEGQFQSEASLLIGATDEQIATYLPNGTFPTSVNGFLIQTFDKRILVDTGMGKNLVGQLTQLGISPDTVDTILLTHMHGDHIGGMLKEGQKLFPTASVHIAAPEAAYWQTMEDAPALPVLQAYSDQIQLFAPSTWAEPLEVLPGIRAISAFGHTPGHTLYLLESNGEKLLIWGDLTHAMVIQMPHPDVRLTYDIDPEAAAASRAVALEMIVQQNLPIAGMHIVSPAMGRIAPQESGGYQFQPF